MSTLIMLMSKGLGLSPYSELGKVIVLVKTDVMLEYIKIGRDVWANISEINLLILAHPNNFLF
jgi:hypothetical protein